MSEEDKELARLMKVRATYKGQITKIESWLNQPGQHDEFDVDSKIDMLESYFKAYNNAQEAVEAVKEDESKERDGVETKVCGLRARLKRMRYKRSQQSSGLTRVAAVDSADPSKILVEVQAPTEVPLPKLPTYDGEDYLSFPNFMASFEALVDQSTASGFTKLKKFGVLRGALRGRALQSIEHLIMSNENYDVAIKILQDRFMKKQLIFQSLIKKLLDLPKVSEQQSLRQVWDSLEATLKAIERIPATTEQIGLGILMNHVLNRVDEDTLSKWEERSAETPKELPTWNQFGDFMTARADTLESRKFLTQERSEKKSKNQDKDSRRDRGNPKQQEKKGYFANKAQCRVCSGQCKTILECKSFIGKPQRERYTWVRANQYCIRCLELLPHTDKCPAEPCVICQKPHNSALHFPDYVPGELRDLDKSNAAKKSYVTNNNQLSDVIHMLATAIVKVKSSSGEWIHARALIDSGSMTHFITNRLAKKLRTRLSKSTIPVVGLFGGQEIRDLTQITIRSCSSEYEFQMQSLVLPEFNHFHPSVRLDISKLSIPSNIRLADPTFNEPQRVDMIIGVGLAFKILMVGQIPLIDNLLLQKSSLGWLVAGELAINLHTTHKFSFTGITQGDDSLQEALERFWELEKVPAPQQNWSAQERFCEQHFQQHTTRSELGRFLVRLPFSSDPDHALGASYYIAESRLKSVERRMAHDAEFRKLYQDFLAEYEQLGHMHEVPESSEERLNFLPHHGVLRPDSSSTKLRVVFDASAATSSGVSLNDLMPHGPTIQPPLFRILLDIRFFRTILSGDIPKMYRQVDVDQDDRRHQCILWRRPGSNTVTKFKLATVTYGTTSAPFLAVRCVTQLAREESELKLAANALLNATYVDNTLCGVSNPEEAIQLYQELKQLLQKGGMDMKKWCSNSKEVLNAIPTEEHETVQAIGDDELVKTLGIRWITTTDEFGITVTPDTSTIKWTKRKIVSHISKIFDPLGLVGPGVVQLKIFAQQLWMKKLHWDESLPQSIATTWTKYLEDLPRLAELRIPRYVFRGEGKITDVQLHCFADASILAYGTVFYIRCLHEDGTVIITNLCSKSRVAPLKRVTLPRLELLGALLLSELLEAVKPSVSHNITKTFCWLDSQVALTWATSSPHKYVDFIASRATTIQERTAGCIWRHVPGVHNPADVLSRGARPSALVKDPSWFAGPAFLHESEEKWKFSKPSSIREDDELLETRKQAMCLYNKLEKDPVQSYKFNGSLYRIQKMFAYVSRYVKVAKGEAETFKEKPFCALDLHEGLLLAVKAVQLQQFHYEYELLKRGKILPASSPMLKLSPFVDDRGLMRVGGRLGNAPDLTFDEAHPLLLPRDHPLSVALFKFHHWSMPHPGPLTMLAAIRRKYWVIGGTVLANRTYRRCVVCTRHARRTFQQVMANLPMPRVMPFRRCFTVVGIDLFGPFQVKHSGRGSIRTTMYVAVIIDFQTKAIQLQYVDGDGTNAIINALLRFANRSGRPSQIWSDNATNFHGANNSFQHVDWDRVDQWCRMTQRIEWKFIPARSPHWGGLWEASVRLAKRHLIKVMNGRVLHWDAFITLISMVEAVVNSRPITPIAVNPSDGQPLTPAHFLIGEPLIAFPDPEPSEFPPGKRNLVKCWLELCEIRSHWIGRWHTELRQTYQMQQKWHTGSKNIRLNKVVFMVDKDKAPHAWTTGRITRLMPGRDGRVRAVEVTCPPLQQGGPERVFTRAVQLLVPVPMDDDEDEE